jgi:quercetin dioxygenase-like cupin family protein
MPAIDRKQIAEDWKQRGFSCELWTDPPGQRWELVTVLEGDVEFEIEGTIHHPQAGDELLIPAGALHSARNIGNTTTRWLYGYRRS